VPKLNKNQFTQAELPLGDIEGPRIKAPHQMSPEEFASHPFAVFHSTHLPAEDVKDPYARSSPGIHLGTDRAATQRHLVTGSVVPRGYTQNASMHVFHHDPGERVQRTTDDVANNYRGNPARTKANAYYENEHEDKGSLSLVVHDPSRLKSHHDYVQQAIKEGKEGEVHPYTMQLYKSGSLNAGHDTAYWVSKQRFNDTLSPEEHRYNEHMNNDQLKLPFDEDGEGFKIFSGIKSPKEGTPIEKILNPDISGLEFNPEAAENHRKFFGAPKKPQEPERNSRGPKKDVLKKIVKERKGKK